MLHELRFYQITAGRILDYVNHAGNVAVPLRGDRYGKLLGFWFCEAGAVNCAFNLWEHESVESREALRSELQRQDAWRDEYLTHSQPLMRRQFSRLLKPFGAVKPPSGMANAYHLRIFRTHAGMTQEFASCLHTDLAAAVQNNAVGTWTGNSGDVNEVVHLSAHPSSEPLAEALQTPQWHAFLKRHGSLVDDIKSSLMMPASFSPWC